MQSKQWKKVWNSYLSIHVSYPSIRPFIWTKWTNAYLINHQHMVSIWLATNFLLKCFHPARREQLRRLRRDVSLTNSSIEAQRGSIPSLSVDCDDDVDCRQCNRSVVLGHGAVAASTPTVQFGFPSRYDPGPQPLRSIGELNLVSTLS